MKLGILNLSVFAFALILSAQTVILAQTSTPQQTVKNYFEWSWKTKFLNSPEAKKFVTDEYFNKLELFLESVVCIYISAEKKDPAQIKFKNVVFKENKARVIADLGKENGVYSDLQIVLVKEKDVWKIDEITNAASPAQKESENYTAPTLTAKEISQRVLKLIKSINGLDKISPSNIEKIIGGKINFDEKDPNSYGYAGKIVDSDWFYHIFSLTGLNGQTSRRLEFSFKSHDDPETELQTVCQFSYADYKKELTAAGFTVNPFYGEHGRLLYWRFAKENLEVDVKTDNYASGECVKTLWINILK